MEQTTTPRPTFTPVYEKGKRVEIAGMAASTIRTNRYQVSKCETCRALVAWAKSSSGKWYVCETKTYSTEGGNERFRAVPYTPHSCVAHVETPTVRTDEQIQVQVDVNRFMDALRRQADGTSTPDDEATIAEFHARAAQLKG